MNDDIQSYQKYRFQDFTMEHYIEILKLLKEKYIVSRYYDFDKNSPFVLLRHDVDFSPQRALRMAKVEKELEINSSYFIHIHSEFYNVLEADIFEIIMDIASLGHDIGIHFDTHFYKIKDHEGIHEFLNFEKELFRKLFQIDVRTFSFHNTNPFILSCQDFEYAGLINTYASYFQKEVSYCSDSNGYWKYSRMHDLVSDGQASRLQLLTHPEWWQEEAMSPWQKIKRAVYGRADKNLSDYLELLRQYKNTNVDW